MIRTIEPLATSMDNIFSTHGYLPPIVAVYLQANHKPSTPYWCSRKYLASTILIGPGVFSDTWTMLTLPPVHLPLSHIYWTPSAQTSGPTPHSSVATAYMLIGSTWLSVFYSLAFSYSTLNVFVSYNIPFPFKKKYINKNEDSDVICRKYILCIL